jgi:hypothetical protein
MNLKSYNLVYAVYEGGDYKRILALQEGYSPHHGLGFYQLFLLVGIYPLCIVVQ